MQRLISTSWGSVAPGSNRARGPTAISSVAAVASPAMPSTAPAPSWRRALLERRIERGHQRRLAPGSIGGTSDRVVQAPQRQREIADRRCRDSSLFCTFRPCSRSSQPSRRRPAAKRVPLAAHLRREHLPPAVQPRPHRPDRAVRRRRRRPGSVSSCRSHRTTASRYATGSAPERPPQRVAPAAPARCPRPDRRCTPGSGARVGHRLVPPVREPPPRLVPRDPEQPRRRPPARAGEYRARLLDDRQEHVLRDVFRRRRRPGHVQREPIHVRPPPPVERPERLAVPRGHGRDQFLVRLGHRLSPGFDVPLSAIFSSAAQAEKFQVPRL